ncbi:MAG TPA: sigma-70 family RNA polymerase sigma factor [Pirellulaceae bacterium]|nr:sigma-70 family RNA polymerase sigma factor [Pirellulaceae bacterium]
MSSNATNAALPAGVQRPFATTRWSIVLAAGKDSSTESRAALVSLCEAYWYPLYAYTRRRGYDADAAQDLTQEFFTRLLDKEYVKAADPQRGRFRSFLLASLNHFLANEWRREQAQKRGGGQKILSLDFADGEGRLSLEPASQLTPEKIYERRWALTLITQALARLREEYTAGGKLPLLEKLQPFLGGQGDAAPYKETAAELGLSEGAVKVAVHRLRRRCRDFLRAEIAQTVSRPEEVEEELRDLLAALG